MAAFPDISQAKYRAPIGVEIEFRTLIQEYGGSEIGEETRKQKRLYPRRHITLAYEYITNSMAQYLWDFFLSKKGSFAAFNFFFRANKSYSDEYVGIGDGSTKFFNLPGKDTTVRTLKQDGASLTESVDWFFHSAAGEDGADQAELNVAPTSGAKLTYTFNGKLKVRCRFRDDIMSYDMFYEAITSTGLRMKGLLNQ